MARFLGAMQAANIKLEPSDHHHRPDNNNISKRRQADQLDLSHGTRIPSSASSACESETGGTDLRSHRSEMRQEDTKKYRTTRSGRRNHSPSDEDKANCNGESLLHNRSSNNHVLQSKGNKSKSLPGKSSGRGLAAFPVIREGLLGKGSGPVDYTRYVKRFANCIECGYQHCRDLNYKEHFHCLDCCEGTRVFVKKEEMIRHFKWHKKRDESLQHGFMRYSPSDDCGDRFAACPHNRKQTHYHCLQDGCEKVYISTSDVQMHANYHRKDSAIIQEGFQRFRAAEDCGADHCAFRHQKTTHFHCRRDECSYTFKNKADMEKHKSYHVKDEQLNRDGFKKFMKHEICNFQTCRFSRVCNHIHCIREGCNYVLHSSGQLYSHKRKHERRDAELAYRKFKLAQTVMRGTISSDLANPFWSDSLALGKSENNVEHSDSSQDGESADADSEDMFKKVILKCNCDATREEHYHCRVESCLNALLRNLETANEHSQNHELEDRISSLAYFTVDPANFDAQDSTIPCVSAKCTYKNKEKHYHCLWDDCSEIILAADEPFKRLEHFRIHEHRQKLEAVSEKEDNDIGNLDDGFFKKKRGRPPKNRTIEFPSGTSDAVFTSFKLPKPRIPGQADRKSSEAIDLKDPIGFISYPGKASCPDASCPFNSASCSHYHCAHPRCHFAVKDVHKLSLHLRDFHSNVDILDGYAYFDRSANCRESKCEFNGNSNHFHCMRDGFIFQRYSSMSSHESECHESKSNPESSDEEELPSNDKQVIKSSGIFFPQQIPQKLSNGESNNNPMDLSGGQTNGDHYIEAKSITDHSLSRILQLPESSETQFGPDSACGRPFCKLKRKCHYHCHLCNQAFSEIEKLRPHVLKHSSLASNLKPTAIESDPESDGSLALKESSDYRNETILSKLKNESTLNSSHSPIISQLDLTSVPAFTPTSLSNFMGYPGTPNPYLFLQQNPFSLYAGMMFGHHGYPSTLSLSHPDMMTGLPIPSSSPLHLPGEDAPSISPLTATALPSSPSSASSITPMKRPPSNASSPASPPSDSKKQRMQLRILKDEPVPEGYVRFRFNEDCSYPHCGYREHQTHFHCTREDCGYSFCDKTRFVQHTARHERLDTLMGGDFKQYRASVACGREDCAYIPQSNGSSSQALQNKASHFHCCKCDFVCTDTNKVVAHRRQHQKLDSIMAAGFEKFTPSQDCNIDGCAHVQKQTHYHCLKCNYAVLGLSQMSAHKYRHSE